VTTRDVKQAIVLFFGSINYFKNKIRTRVARRKKRPNSLPPYPEPRERDSLFISLCYRFIGYRAEAFVHSGTLFPPGASHSGEVNRLIAFHVADPHKPTPAMHACAHAGETTLSAMRCSTHVHAQQSTHAYTTTIQEIGPESSFFRSPRTFSAYSYPSGASKAGHTPRPSHTGAARTL
jgi:hypothetical protein